MKSNKRGHSLPSPALKTLFFLISTVVSGVLSGVFVAQIMDQNIFRWGKFYRVWSFYALLALAILVYLYNRYSYRKDKSLREFIDAEFCDAYMREQCLPEMAERLKTLIRQGKSPAELKQYKDFTETFYR